MTSIAITVIKAAIDLALNKGRDKAAESLKDGDVTDQKFRGMIVREIDEIKWKLDGIARKDLKASMSHFTEGIEFLYDVFEKTRSRRDNGSVTAQAASETASAAETVSLTNEMRMLELTGLDESAMRALTSAKKRFKEARRKATEAFANEALGLSDRVQAMQYRVMATILEAVDNPSDALPACKACIRELHSLTAVKKCFSVELKKGIWARFSKNERRTIISTVCHLNRAIYDVTLMVTGRREVWMLPRVDAGDEGVDPLLDTRIAEVLQTQGMEHCRIPWSFGRKGEVNPKLESPTCVVTNAKGQFLVAERGNNSVMVFNSSGDFLFNFYPQIDEAFTALDILNVTTDLNGNTFVLVQQRKSGPEGYEWAFEVRREVQVFKSTDDRSPDLLHTFPVRNADGDRMTVSDGRLLVLRGKEGRFVVDVYETDGKFVCSFGEGALEDAIDVTTGPDGLVRILDRYGFCVCVFTNHGQQHSKFHLKSEGDRMACHPAGEHIVVAGKERETNSLRVEIYNKDGEFKRKIQLDDVKLNWIEGITVTMQGHIAVAVGNVFGTGRIVVL